MSNFLSHVYIKNQFWNFKVGVRFKLKSKGGDIIKLSVYQKHWTLWFVMVYCKVYKIFPSLNLFAHIDNIILHVWVQNWLIRAAENTASCSNINGHSIDMESYVN